MSDSLSPEVVSILDLRWQYQSTNPEMPHKGSNPNKIKFINNSLVSTRSRYRLRMMAAYYVIKSRFEDAYRYSFVARALPRCRWLVAARGYPGNTHSDSHRRQCTGTINSIYPLDDLDIFFVLHIRRLNRLPCRRQVVLAVHRFCCTRGYNCLEHRAVVTYHRGQARSSLDRKRSVSADLCVCACGRPTPHFVSKPARMRHVDLQLPALESIWTRNTICARRRDIPFNPLH